MEETNIKLKELMMKINSKEQKNPQKTKKKKNPHHWLYEG